MRSFEIEKTAVNSIVPVRPMDGLPDEFRSMRVGDFIDSEDMEVHIRKGKISMRRRTEDFVATLDYSQYETGRCIASSSSVPVRGRKSEYIDDIRQMRCEGMTQEDIAFELCMSQSYVSRLLRDYDGR